MIKQVIIPLAEYELMKRKIDELEKRQKEIKLTLHSQISLDGAWKLSCTHTEVYVESDFEYNVEALQEFIQQQASAVFSERMMQEAIRRKAQTTLSKPQPKSLWDKISEWF